MGDEEGREHTESQGEVEPRGRAMETKNATEIMAPGAEMMDPT